MRVAYTSLMVQRNVAMIVYILFCWLCFPLVNVVDSSSTNTIRIGFLYPVDVDLTPPGPLLKAAKLGRDLLNTDESLSAIRSYGYTFELVPTQSFCNASDGLYQLIKLVSGNNTSARGIQALIGPGCDAICEKGAMLTSDWQIPTISYGCLSNGLSDKDRYPFLARTITTVDEVYGLVKNVIRYFGWDHITFVHESDGVSLETGTLFGNRIRLEENMTVKTIEISFLKNSELAAGTLKQLTANERVFVLMVYSLHLGDFLLLAQSLGLMNGEYVFITVLASREVISRQRDTKRREQLIVALEGVLDLNFETPPNHEDDSQKCFMHNLYHAHFNETKNETTPGLVYDAFYTYGLAVNETLSTYGENYSMSTEEILATLFPRSFQGVSGQVMLDDNGNRQMDFNIYNFRKDRKLLIGHYVSSTMAVTLFPDVEIVWPGGFTEKPDGVPDCGWQDQLCEHQNIVKVALGATFGCLLVLLLIIAAAVYLYKSRKQQQEMESMTWRISGAELKAGTRKPINFGSSVSKGTFDSTEKSTISMGTMGSAASTDSTSLNNQVFTSVASFRGSMVAIKPIHKYYIAVTDAVVQEINVIRSLQHFNVNQLIGACVEPQKISLVSRYCGRGSLSDVLENERIKLDWIFKISFAADIANGLAFVHDSPIECHGRLKSSNVYIDSHWTCKVGDFSMPHFREGEKPPNNGKHAQYYQLLWTAPEFLRDPSSSPRGTKKGDVYSFSIILQEIILRSGPYFHSSMEPEDIIERVKKVEHPWFRPFVPSTAAEEGVLDLMRICWEEIPAFRPNFITVRDTLKKMNNGHKINLVDQMVHMMEKYADHLEELVEERTTQLAEEQKKTDELLGRMLPKKITADLKQGKHVAPESFESVTIFFSDIVGFTALAGGSTPLEVVDFLNDLYTCFDNVIDTYDVYKVETIGDAYMVVSGLPVKNGIRHAGEIATMGLDLLSSVVNFRIRHRPEKQLQLRIGVHSGPAVAGVVGLKMPRYCLFGDTVNYASRMESTGLALRIHISPECADLLKSIGGFILSDRGDVCMKGKGVIKTYFLQGKEGFNKVLPDLSKAASLEEHNFK